MASTRDLLTRILWAVALLFASPFLLSLFGCFPWSEINCWHYDVDIHSGRIRYTHYLAYFPVVQRIEHSALSRELQSKDTRDHQSDWQRVHTFSPCVRTSPHYRFHSAIFQIEELELDWQLGEFTAAARRSSAQRVLDLWQQEQSDNAADSYLQALGELAIGRAEERRSTDKHDLPTIERDID